MSVSSCTERIVVRGLTAQRAAGAGLLPLLKPRVHNVDCRVVFVMCEFFFLLLPPLILWDRNSERPWCTGHARWLIGRKPR